MTYLTLLSNGSPFGFSNLLAPELGFRSYYPLNYYSGFFADIKYAPLGAFTGIQEYALDVSLGWSRRLPNYHRFEIKLNYSDLAYQPETDLKIQTQLFSLRFGYTI
jgi:hypothetical protein